MERSANGYGGLLFRRGLIHRLWFRAVHARGPAGTLRLDLPPSISVGCHDVGLQLALPPRWPPLGLQALVSPVILPAPSATRPKVLSSASSGPPCFFVPIVVLPLAVAMVALTLFRQVNVRSVTPRFAADGSRQEVGGLRSGGLCQSG